MWLSVVAPHGITNIVMKLLRLVLQVEMSWYHSLVLSVEQYIMTQLS